VNNAARHDLVLLPGWSMPVAVFAPLLALLPETVRVTVMPLPQATSLQAMAQRALAAAPENAVWCGWSLGGLVAAQAALLQPARVAALLSLATSPAFVARADWPQAMPAADLAAFSAGLSGAAPDLAATLTRFDALQSRGSANARAELRQLRALRNAAPPPSAAVLHDGLQVLHDGDLRAGLARISCPSTWLYGEQDALVPVSVAADVRKLLPRARVEVVAHASHFGVVADAQMLAAVLAASIADATATQQPQTALLASPGAL
jgi:pimeloyl-[acyl-carrier protein] methyl ester esterase